MIEIKYYERNPIPPTFWGLLTGTYNHSITKIRYVDDQELYEIGLLLVCGIDQPYQFKKEPILYCAKVINGAMEAVNKNPIVIQLYRKFEAIAKRQIELENKHQ